VYVGGVMLVETAHLGGGRALGCVPLRSTVACGPRLTCSCALVGAQVFWRYWHALHGGSEEACAAGASEEQETRLTSVERSLVS
jgi:hypothetical protein